MPSLSITAQQSEARSAEREFLRHTLATLAYRGGKVVRGVPSEVSGFKAGEGIRTPGEILAHIGDLLDWALGLARGKHVWNESPRLSWEDQVARFFANLQDFDSYLNSAETLGWPPERLFQGPIADALTHVGQISMLRRMAGAPVRGENYFKAEIEIGRVGTDQSSKRVEFD